MYVERDKIFNVFTDYVPQYLIEELVSVDLWKDNIHLPDLNILNMNGCCIPTLKEHIYQKDLFYLWNVNQFVYLFC